MNLIANLKITGRIFPIIIAVVMCVTAVRASAADEPPKSLKALFIGNSFCDYHVIPGQVAAMIKHSGGDAVMKRQTKGGFNLEKHWNAGEAQERLKKEEWDLIVLQNHSRTPVEFRQSFDEFGQKFIEFVKKETKAKPIL